MSGSITETVPTSPTALHSVIKSYLYWEYQDDDTCQAFVDAYNQFAQAYVDWFNNINLPIYSGPLIVGSLLDWVAAGLYGFERPTLVSGTLLLIGSYNTQAYDEAAYNTQTSVGSLTYVTVNDDIFKRILTWHLYRGDGFQFSTEWLKRRLVRFLNGPNGVPPLIDQTYDVSVTYASGTATITLPSSATSMILADALTSGVLAIPFQLSISVVVL